MEIGFDIISDLRLGPEDSFNWEGKPTSLYCLIPGNISSDYRTIVQTLAHLGRLYQGIFYIPGTLEYEGADDVSGKTKQILDLPNKVRNLAILHHNVILIDGIAILGANGWGEPTDNYSFHKQVHVDSARLEDASYLHKCIDKLQRHLDVKKIVVVSSAVPNLDLFFGQEPKFIEHILPLKTALLRDTEKKVSHWVFGTFDKDVDTIIDSVNYVNNSYFKKNPYWAKRITVNF